MLLLRGAVLAFCAIALASVARAAGSDIPPPLHEALRTLAAERMARLQTVLREKHGIAPERIARRDPAADVAEGPPAVRFEIGAASAAAGAR